MVGAYLCLQNVAYGLTVGPLLWPLFADLYVPRKEKLLDT
jgi:hypothetical protein